VERHQPAGQNKHKQDGIILEPERTSTCVVDDGLIHNMNHHSGTAAAYCHDQCHSKRAVFSSINLLLAAQSTS
jgi:hypothetical protein